MNKISSIIFDLDGVLIETKLLHFNAVNMALKEVYGISISYEDHLRIYDGLSTKKKIEKLINLNLIPNDNRISEFYTKKQKITKSLLLEEIAFNTNIYNTIKCLSEKYVLALATNSITESTDIILQNLKIKEFFSSIVTNEDVKNPKPHPEIYLKTIINLNEIPKNVLIVEDSVNGVKSAMDSGANVLIVKSPLDVNVNNIETFIMNKKPETKKIELDNLNILVPMAGEGSRFSKAGYSFPKPLIPVPNFAGDAMIKVVFDSLNISAKTTFIVRSEHNQKYSLNNFLKTVSKNCNVVECAKLTEGAACTSLLATEYIDNDKELLIVNSDQFIEWDTFQFFYEVSNKNVDGAILTFKNNHPKWSYVSVDDKGYVNKVVEKVVISDIATVGIYYFKRGSDYVKYANQMISKGNSTKVNNEWYIAPIYNEMIEDGKKIIPFDVNKMWSLGVPEDLNFFIDNYEK